MRQLNRKELCANVQMCKCAFQIRRSARSLRLALTVITLLLLHTHVFSQEEPYVADTTIVTVDSSAEVSSMDYMQEEDLRRAPAVPDTPVFREIPDSVIRNLQNSKDFAYANDAEYWPKKEVIGSDNDSTAQTRTRSSSDGSWIDRLTAVTWFRYLIFGILIAVLLYAIIKIAISNRLIMFKGTGPSISDEEHELMQESDLRGMITTAEQQQQYRLAVRYRYMKLLKDLDERNIIQLDAKATNWDYVQRMGQHSLKKQFLLLTRAYEYAWYGEFEVNGDQYGYIRTEFEKMENSLY